MASPLCQRHPGLIKPGVSWEQARGEITVTLIDAIRDRCRVIQEQAGTLAQALTEVGDHLDIPTAQAAHVLLLLDGICEKLEDAAERLSSGVDPAALTEDNPPENPQTLGPGP
jgi:hypothetical protein